MTEQANLRDPQTRIIGLVDGYMPTTPPKPVANIPAVTTVPAPTNEKVVAGKDVFKEGLAQTPTSQPVAAVVKSIHDASEGAKSWREHKGGLSFTEAVNGGEADISVVIKDQEPADRLLGVLEGLDDLAVDVYIAAITHWLHNAKGPAEPVWIHVDQILKYRGIQPKMKDGYSAGYRPEERRAVVDRFERLDRIFIYLRRFIVYSRGRGKAPREITMESKILGISDRLVENGEVVAFKVCPGEYGRYLCDGQTGLMFRRILEYDFYRQDWEKRIGLYLVFQWAIRKAHGTLQQPFRISTILENIRKELNVRYPRKTLVRFEQALNTLKADGIIRGWRYDAKGGPDMNRRDWILDWSNRTITVYTPPTIDERYGQVEQNRNKIRSNRGR